MEKKSALNTIKANNLIPGPISREILRLLINDELFDKERYKNYISIEQFLNLRKNYLEKIIELTKSGEYNNDSPKYFPFYKLIQEKYPNVTWIIRPDLQRKPIVKFVSPKVKNIRPSLLSLLLNKVVSYNCLLTEKYSCFERLPEDGIKILSAFIEKVEALYPSDNQMQKIVEWLAICLKNQKATVFLPICPDYSAEPVNSVKYFFKHNFQNLGSGIGLIAQRILKILPYLQEMFIKLDVQPTIISGIADFEGYSEGNLQKLNLTEEQFLEQVNLSRLAFEKKSKITTLMIAEKFGGKDKWLKIKQQIRKDFESGNFGNCNVEPTTALLNVARKRAVLYSRWYGKKTSLNEYIPIALEQSLDYAIMGIFIRENWENCLVLAADNDVMAPFYSYSKAIPTLYLKRYYC